MIAPSTRLVVRTVAQHALGALGALAIVAGAIVAVADAHAGLALVAAGMGLLCICWGLTGRHRPTRVHGASAECPSSAARRVAAAVGASG